MVDVVIIHLQAAALLVFSLIYGQIYPKVVVYDLPCIHGYESYTHVPEGRLAYKISVQGHDIPFPLTPPGAGLPSGRTPEEVFTGCAVFIDKTVAVKWEDGTVVQYSPLGFSVAE